MLWFDRNSATIILLISIVTLILIVVLQQFNFIFATVSFARLWWSYLPFTIIYDSARSGKSKVLVLEATWLFTPDKTLTLAVKNIDSSVLVICNESLQTQSTPGSSVKIISEAQFCCRTQYWSAWMPMTTPLFSWRTECGWTGTFYFSTCHSCSLDINFWGSLSQIGGRSG